MSTEQQSDESDRLLSFCQKIAEQRENWPPSEEDLATQFIAFFGVSTVTHFGNLSQLCVQLGISVSVRTMPTELRGCNAAYNGTRTIAIAEDERFPGVKEHTLLHELRELLEHTFVGLGLAVAVNQDDLEHRAELFACLVRSDLSQNLMLVGLKHVEQVERKWLRYGLYAITVLVGVAMVVSCYLLPVFEDQALAYRQQRLRDNKRSNSPR